MDTALLLQCEALARGYHKVEIDCRTRCPSLAQSIIQRSETHAHDAVPIHSVGMLHSRRLLRDFVCTITNTDLTDVQWIQATLPVEIGGLGVRRVSSLAPSAFLASTAGTRDLRDMTLSKCDASVRSAADFAFVEWSIAYGQPGALPPVGSASTKQEEWDMN